MRISVTDGWVLVGEPMCLVDAKTQPPNSQTLDLSCAERLFRKESDVPMSFTITSPSQVPCKRISITSSARFFEIYSVNAKSEEVYVATCRGSAVAKNVFECIHDTPLAISTIKIKFLSLKPVAGEMTADFSLQHMSLHVRDPAHIPASPPSPAPASTPAPSTSMDGLLLMLPMLKATIMNDLSQLLDTKLSPIYHKLHHMEAALHSLESSVHALTAQYPSYNTLSSEHAELNHSISFVDHDDIPTIDESSLNSATVEITEPSSHTVDDVCITDNDAVQFIVENTNNNAENQELKQDMKRLLTLLRESSEADVEQA